VFSRRAFNKFKYELIFIGLSLLLILGIGLLPETIPTPETPSATIVTVSAIPTSVK